MENALISKYIALVIFIAAAFFTAIKGKYLLALIPAVASVAYFSMINDPANTEKFRYLDWAVTTPLMLIAIFSANHINTNLIAGVVVLDLIMVYYGYKGTQDISMEQKKIDFWISFAAFLPILYLLSKCKLTKSAKYLTLIVWFLYPVVWYVNELGSFSMEVTTIMYAIMDVCAKVGLVYFLQM